MREYEIVKDRDG